MSSQKTTPVKWFISILLLAIASLGFAYAYYQFDSSPELFINKKIELKNNIDDKSQKILKDMSNSLKSLNEFSLKSKGYFELLDSTGKKEKINNSGEAYVKRPDKIKVQRTGEKADVELYCDGKQVTLYGKKLNYYATAPAASTLNETLDNIGDNLGIYLPGSDLLYTDVYEGLTQDVTSGKYIGKEEVSNVKCDHLSFTGKDVDWQIWIEETGKKLPRKYVIISKDAEEKLETSIEITEWKTDVKLDDKQFTFTPPKGAKKIDFLTPEKEDQTKAKTK